MKITIVNNTECDMQHVTGFVNKAYKEMMSKPQNQFYIIKTIGGDLYANVFKTKNSLSVKINP